jgi:ArsR family transcriptional regulator
MPLPLRECADLFQALSDETRLTILDRLRASERCVCELQDALDASQPRLSFHLRVLRNAGLVATRKEGRRSYYALVPGRLEAALETIRPSSSWLPVRTRATIGCCRRVFLVSNISTKLDERMRP